VVIVEVHTCFDRHHDMDAAVIVPLDPSATTWMSRFAVGTPTESDVHPLARRVHWT